MPVEKFLEIAELIRLDRHAPTRSAASSTPSASPTTPPACRSSAASAWSRCCWATSAGPAAASTPSGATPTSRATPTTPSAGRSSPATSAIPRPGMETMADYIGQVPAKPLRPNAVNYFGTNYKKFLVSTLKAFYGDAATARQRLRATRWMPKPAKNSSWLTIHDEARSGTARRASSTAACHGVTIGPDSNRMAESLAQAQVAGRSWTRCRPPTSEFWHAPGVDADDDPDRGLLPPGHPLDREGRHRSSTPAGGPSGSTRSSTPPARSRTTTGSSATSSCGCGTLYAQGGRGAARAHPQPDVGLHRPGQPGAGGDRPGDQRLRPHHRPAAGVVRRPASDDGTTSRRRTGSTPARIPEEGNLMAPPGHRRSDRHGLLPQLGVVVAAQPADPLQPGLGRRRRAAVGPDPAGHQVERHGLGRRRPRLPGHVRARRRARARSS